MAMKPAAVLLAAFFLGAASASSVVDQKCFGNRCFYLIRTKGNEYQTADLAAAECEAKVDGRLASIDDESVKAHFGPLTDKPWAWVDGTGPAEGSKDGADFKLHNGESIPDAMWNKDEPNQVTKRKGIPELCVIMANGGLADYPCNSKKYYTIRDVICETTSSVSVVEEKCMNKRCFYLIRTKGKELRNADDAATECRLKFKDGALASVDEKEILDHFGPLTDKPWAWVDGSATVEAGSRDRADFKLHNGNVIPDEMWGKGEPNQATKKKKKGPELCVINTDHGRRRARRLPVRLEQVVQAEECTVRKQRIGIMLLPCHLEKNGAYFHT